MFPIFTTLNSTFIFKNQKSINKHCLSLNKKLYILEKNIDITILYYITYISTRIKTQTLPKYFWQIFLQRTRLFLKTEVSERAKQLND